MATKKMFDKDGNEFFRDHVCPCRLTTGPMFKYLAIVLAIGATGARADLITESAVDPTSTFQGGFAPLTFKQFDPSLGKLNSVTVTIGGRVDNTFSMTFFNPATITLTVDEAFGVKGFFDIVSGPRTTSHTASSGSYHPQVLEFTGGGTVAGNPTDWTGHGVMSYPVTSSAVSGFQSSSGNGAGFVTTTGSVWGNVRFDFTPYSPIPEHSSSGQSVPEPSPFALAGFGVLALVVYRAWVKGSLKLAS